jgi:hypothetical protein
LKSKDGAKALATFQKKISIQRKAKAGMDVETASLVSMANIQLNEMNNVKKERRAEIEELILEARRTLALLQDELEAVTEQVDDQHLPMSNYTGPDEDDLIEQCYELYRLDAEANQSTPEPMAFHVIDMVKTKYGDAVKARHVADFLQDEERTNQLKLWIDQMILKKDQVGDKKEANTFRCFMDNAGGAMDAEARTQAEASVARARTRREGRRRNSSDVSEANIIMETLRTNIRSRRVRGQAETTIAQVRREPDNVGEPTPPQPTNDSAPAPVLLEGRVDPNSPTAYE